MNLRERHICHLRAAEAQFRLATTVRLAVTLDLQPLDLLTQWWHGSHIVNGSEVSLTREEADFAASNLERSATFLMASAALNAIKSTILNPKSHSNQQVVSAYQIVRMVRNAFAHSPFNPIWNIDADCRNKRFEVEGVIHLNCEELNGRPFDWRHYGGPLALFRLCQFVRYNLLGDRKMPVEDNKDDE